MANPTITLTGRLTADPELRFTPNGVAVASLTIATSDRKKDGEEWTDVDPSFWRCTAWRQLAEALVDLRKGQAVVAHGKIKQRDYTTREGEKRTAFEIDLEAIGPDLRWAQSGSQPRPAAAPAVDPWAATSTPGADPWAAKSAPDEPPF